MFSDHYRHKCFFQWYRVALFFCFCFFFIAYNAAVFASGRSMAKAPVVFSNLGKEIALIPDGEDYFLQQQGVKQKITLVNRLIISAESTLDAQTLKQLDSRIERVQQLAVLTKSNLWLVAFSGADVQGLMDKLQQHKFVLYIQPDILQVMQAAQNNAISLSGTMLNIDERVGVNKVRLAIIDDGFNFNHPEFANINLVFEYDADQRVESATPKSKLDQHGTLVAGVIAAAADKKGIDGLAPDVELIAIRQVSSWTSDMILAFSVARMMKADIVNSSWVLPFLPEPLFDLLADWMQAQQPYLIFAAGNNQQDACKVNALSQLNNVWLIGAADKDGERLPYSNYGSCITLYAPAQFMSTAASGQGYKAFSGTSAATAYVSGVLARELTAGEKPDRLAIQQLLKESN